MGVQFKFETMSNANSLALIFHAVPFEKRNLNVTMECQWQWQWQLKQCLNVKRAWKLL